MVDLIRAPLQRFAVPEEMVPVRTPKVLVNPNGLYNDELQEVVERYAFDPLGFIESTIDWELAKRLYPDCTGILEWQRDCLTDITEGFARDLRIFRLAVASGRGVGKTTVAAWCVLWSIGTHPDGQTTAMSVTGVNLRSRLWREVRKWRRVWKFASEFDMTATGLQHKQIDTWSGHVQMYNVDRLPALRGSHEHFLGFVIDEATGIPDDALVELEAGLTGPHSFIAYFSNPSKRHGRFYECFTARSHLWHAIHVDAREVPIVHPAHIQDILDECQGDVDAYRFRVEVIGQFPLEDYDTVIPQSLIVKALQREPIVKKLDEVVIGVDVARKGVNKTVFMVRGYDEILEIRRYSKQEIDVTAERLIELINEYIDKGYEKIYVCIDADGVGAGVFDLCQKAKYQYYNRFKCVEVIEVRSGTKAVLETRYVNVRAELSFEGTRNWIKTIGCLDRKEKSLIEQLGDIYYTRDNVGRVLIESKEDMQNRGIQSPDEADALSYTFVPKSKSNIRWTFL